MRIHPDVDGFTIDSLNQAYLWFSHEVLCVPAVPLHRIMRLQITQMMLD